MERETLERHLADGLSLARIGEIVDRHPSTVAYWLRKHGLIAVQRERYAPKGGIPRETLAPLVESGLSIRDIAAALGAGYSTVRYWLGRHDLRTERARRTGVPAPERPSQVLRICRHHGRTTFVRINARHYRCLECRRDAVVRQRRRMKLTLIEEAGGRCALCGFDSWPAALQFHHVDPTTKTFHISNGGRTMSLARLRAEARKCVLLCANCHAGVEAGAVTLPATLLDSRMQQAVRGSSMAERAAVNR